MPHEKIGDVLVAQGKLEDALKAYRDTHAIRERLASADPSNTRWQNDLSWFYRKIGNVLVAQGKLEEALKIYRDSLAIAERLAAADLSNMQWQRDLATSYEGVGNVMVAQGKLDEARKFYRDSLVIRDRLAEADPRNMEWRDNLDGLAYQFVLTRDFQEALELTNRAISLRSNTIWLYTNRAHALMFLGRADEARALYLKYRGTKNVFQGKPWDTAILEDFSDLRKAGLTHPLMDEIEKRFAAGG